MIMKGHSITALHSQLVALMSKCQRDPRRITKSRARNFSKSAPAQSLSLLFLSPLPFFSFFLHKHKPDSHEYEIEHQ